MKKDLDQIKTEILSRLDIKTEYETLGIIFKGNPNSIGWIPCRNPYNADKHPSCGVNISSGSHRGYLCAFNTSGNRGKPYAAFSFWDIACDFLPGAGGDFSYVLKHYAKKTGVKFGSGRKPPTKMMVDEFMAALPQDAREYLNTKRGLSDESIKKYEIGFRRYDKRNTFPVYDESGELVNIRYHNSKKKPKTLNHSGFGQARLWGVDRLVKAPPASLIVVTEGECFPGNAEVLSPNGWIRLDQYSGEKVLQIHEGMAGEYVFPRAYIEKKFHGKLIHNFLQGWTSITTPKHNLVSVTRSGNWRKFPADYKLSSANKIPRTSFVNAPGISLSNIELQLYVAINADGAIDTRVNGDQYIRFHFSKKRKVDRLLALLEKLKIQKSFTEYKDGTFGICFSLSIFEVSKFFPNEWIGLATLDQRKLIINELDYWDGYKVRDINSEYTTTIEHNAIWVQSIAHTCGETANIFKRKRRGHQWFSVILSHQKQFSGTRSIKSKEVLHHGKVYCVQVPSGMILVRQNGHITISGNCDAMLVEQETGLVAVSPTNGKSAFDRSWIPFFHGHHAILTWDCDEAGRKAVEKIIIPAFQDSILSGKVLSLKIIWLYARDAPKDEKDFTDFIVKSGGSGAQLLDQIKSTQPYKYSQEQIENPQADPDLFFDGSTFVATEMSDYIQSKFNFIHDGSTFFQYEQSNGYWKECEEHILARIISDALGRRMKKTYVSDSLKTLEWKLFKSPHELKLNPYLINMANGMLDIENGEFVPHDKKHLSRIQIPIEFDEQAECPRWIQFLREIFPDDPDKSKALQDFAGYCFLHEIPFEKCLFLVGSGANGKSVFINTLTKIVGFDNTCSLDPQVFGKDKFLLGSLKDKLLNTCSELDAREQIAANVFKKVVSGDLIQADLKYQKTPYRFFPIAKHVFSMNETPVITDRSFAFERRLIIVRFNQTFRGKKVDHQLEKKLAQELSGIFNWAMNGLARVMDGYQGITETEQMVKDRKAFIQQVNPVLMFVDEKCEIDESESVWKTEIYTRYAEWCKESGLRQLSKIRFYNQIVSDFPMITEAKPKGGGKREFRGIGMKFDD